MLALSHLGLYCDSSIFLWPLSRLLSSHWLWPLIPFQTIYACVPTQSWSTIYVVSPWHRGAPSAPLVMPNYVRSQVRQPLDTWHKRYCNITQLAHCCYKNGQCTMKRTMLVFERRDIKEIGKTIWEQERELCEGEALAKRSPNFKAVFYKLYVESGIIN
jgi:hypothetical protein